MSPESDIETVPVNFSRGEYERLHEVANAEGIPLENFLHERAMETVELLEAVAFVGRGATDKDEDGPMVGPWSAYIDRTLRDEVPLPPDHLYVGYNIESVESGRAVLTFQPEGHHANPMGGLQGGFLCTLADAAMGWAYASELDDDETFTTLEMKINFLKPVWDTPLEATGTVVKKGRTVGLVECDVTNEDGGLVAHIIATCMTLRGEMAGGRGSPA